MSSNDVATDAHRTSTMAAADVSFPPQNGRHHAESSSQASVKSSVGGRSSTTNDRLLGKEQGATFDGPKDATTSHGHRSRKSGGFLLDSVLTNGRARGNEIALHRTRGKRSLEQPNGLVPVDKGKLSSSRFSMESSPRSSPLSREVSVDAVDGTGYTSPDASLEAKQPALDPAQLVQMALSLSDSRKRHVSNPLQAPSSPVSGRRVVSGLDSAFGTVRATPLKANRVLDSSTDQTPDSVRVSEPNDGQKGLTADTENVIYTFSPPTLSRAEKARKYFELAREHRRLLEHLPPLKPEGRVRVEDNHDPTRIEHRYQLGRPYNPLQALRNRRIRDRERRQLPAPAETFLETDDIKKWVDGVATASTQTDFRPGEDLVRLPRFDGEQDGSASFRPETVRGHRRTNTANSVITRPENNWSIEPAELLADTYWVEKGDNKSYIEDHRGRRIFQCYGALRANQPRQSVESSRMTDLTLDKRSVNDESDSDDKVRHRHRTKLHIPARLRRNRMLGSRSASVSSQNSSTDGRNASASHLHYFEDAEMNIGSLERHMQELIARDERGELSSPEVTSPDHWDFQRLISPAQRLGSEMPSHDGINRANGRLSVDIQRPRRASSVDGRVEKVTRSSSSMDDLGSDVPKSPAMPARISTTLSDLSPMSAQRASPSENKPRGARLPILRSRSKDRNRIEQMDFANQIGTKLSPVHRAEASDVPPSRRSIESSRPSTMLRQDTRDSTTSSLRRLNTDTTTADGSTVSSGGRRFFKGGRIGELVRNEGSRLGDRFRSSRDRAGDVSDVSRAASDVSDVEDDSTSYRFTSSMNERDVDSDVSPRASVDGGRPKPKYFTSNLPSFTSPAGRDKRGANATSTMDSDPVARQQQVKREAGRSPRFDRLAPPRINLPDEDSVSILEPTAGNPRDSAAIDVNRKRSGSASRQSSLSLDSPGAIVIRPGRRSLASKSDAKRHWSISDQRPPAKANKVTHRDIARVRALLLASGIKAHEILQQCHTVRDPPAPALVHAAQSVAQPVPPAVARQDENLVAARLLSDDLGATLAAFEATLGRFQTGTATAWAARLDALRHRAADQLTLLVAETSDEADAFNVELTTRQPLEVKRVDDAVDAMFRQRRRQFRLVRRAGFKLLEWLVLALMWWVWFVVVLINTARKLVLGILAFLRWLLWF